MIKCKQNANFEVQEKTKKYKKITSHLGLCQERVKKLTQRDKQGREEGRE